MSNLFRQMRQKYKVIAPQSETVEITEDYSKSESKMPKIHDFLHSNSRLQGQHMPCIVPTNNTSGSF